MFYIFHNEDVHFLEAGFAVSSKLFKKATDRNRIKRLSREAYRLQKNNISDHLQNANLRLALFFVYNGKELPEQAVVNKKIGLILQRLIGIINENVSLHN